MSTTMSVDRSLKERWINGFKLAFFASVLFGLVGFPFTLAQDGIEYLVRGQSCGVTLAAWLLYLILALLTYPIMFDWLAAVFRIQFVRKSIRLPHKPVRPSIPPPSPSEPPPPPG